MTAPVASSVVLPDDSGNAGKKIRTQTRSVGGNTVHEHFFVPSTQYTVTGHYYFSSTQQTVSATVQNGTTSGFFWLANQAASTITAVIRRIAVDSNAGSALATPTAPVISFSKFTFTGTPSGGTVSPLKWQTAAATGQLVIYTAMTGMTIAIVGDVGQFAVPSAETGVGCFYAYKEVFSRNPLGFVRGMDLELAPGEGLAIWQSVAGTTADTRKFGVQVGYDEVDLS